MLCVIDLVCLTIGGATDQNFNKPTFDLVLRHIFHYLHNMSGRRPPEDMEQLFDKIFTRCALNIAYIGRNSYKRTHPRKVVTFKYAMSFFDPAKKVATEELVLILSSLRYLFFKVLYI